MMILDSGLLFLGHPVNYKHETHALAYPFKAGSWQI